LITDVIHYLLLFDSINKETFIQLSDSNEALSA